MGGPVGHVSDAPRPASLTGCPVTPAEYERMYRLEDSLWWYRGLHARVLAAARRCLDGVSDGRILDAGCGTGAMAARLSQLGKVTALDVSPVAVSFAARRSLTRLAQGSVTRLPVRDEAFDLVLSLDVLCHGAVEDVDQAMGEMARVLRPGGHMILNLPAYPFLCSAHDRGVFNTRRFTFRQARDIIRRPGLEPRELRFWNSLLFPAAALQRLLRRHGEATSDLVAPPSWVNALLDRTLAAEAALTRGAALPFGLSIFAVGRK